MFFIRYLANGLLDSLGPLCAFNGLGGVMKPYKSEVGFKAGVGTEYVPALTMRDAIYFCFTTSAYCVLTFLWPRECTWYIFEMIFLRGIWVFIFSCDNN